MRGKSPRILKFRSNKKPPRLPRRMSSVTDEELHNLMGPGGGAKKRVVKKKKIPMIGHLGVS